MVAFRFKSRFVGPIQAKTKVMTIRKMRKRNARVGDALQLYSGSRFKPVLIGYAACLSVGHITLDLHNDLVKMWVTSGADRIDTAARLDLFAGMDGFDDWSDMRAFWNITHDAQAFDGWVTFWGDTYQAPGEVAA